MSNNININKTMLSATLSSIKTYTLREDHTKVVSHQGLSIEEIVTGDEEPPGE